MIGLFFGSFNPIHNGHLQIARYLLSHHLCQEVWFVVSPQNPFKLNRTLLAEEYRLELVKKAIQPYRGLKACNVEFALNKPSYTVDTLIYLRRHYPDKRFALIMGGDNLKTLHLWKSYEKILEWTPIFVYPRPGEEISDIRYKGVTVIDAPQTSISSTKIRNKVHHHESISAYVPGSILTDVENLYK